MPNQMFRKLEKVRNLPDMRLLWDKVFLSGFRGRSWGKKKKEVKNPFGGSYVVLFDGKNIVDFFQDPISGEFIILQFEKKTEGDTDLGEEVKKILTEAGYDFIG